MTTASKQQTKSSRKKGGLKGRVLFLFLLLSAVIFLPSTILLTVGMAPTIVAVFVARSNLKSQAVSVGAMNLVGCMPYLLDLWTKGHIVEKSMSMISDPLIISIIYACAMMGYVLCWVIVQVISLVIHNNMLKEKKELTRQQDLLVERWGEEVRGHIRLNHLGFAVESDSIGGPPEDEP